MKMNAYAIFSRPAALLAGAFALISCAGKPGPAEIAGHRFIDLGLPSGLLWAETNVGASSETGSGDYFAWGETAPKADYGWETYAYGNGEDSLTKYTRAGGPYALELSDDAAAVNWGEGCRMPTLAEFAELRDTLNCTWTWTARPDSDGTSVNGYLVTSRANGNSIFLPAAGCRDGSESLYEGSRGYYWSRSLNPLYDFYADYLCLESDFPYIGHDDRSFGLPVRPVAERQTASARLP